MKLSEAIRKGSEITCPLNGAYFEYNFDDHKVCACAMGAALCAVKPELLEDVKSMRTFPTDSQLFNMAEEFFGEILFKYPQELIEEGYTYEEDIGSLVSVVIELNDECDWTRERIADWLDQKGF